MKIFHFDYAKLVAQTNITGIKMRHIIPNVILLFQIKTILSLSVFFFFISFELIFDFLEHSPITFYFNIISHFERNHPQ